MLNIKQLCSRSQHGDGHINNMSNQEIQYRHIHCLAIIENFAKLHKKFNNNKTKLDIYQILKRDSKYQIPFWGLELSKEEDE